MLRGSRLKKTFINDITPRVHLLHPILFHKKCLIYLTLDFSGLKVLTYPELYDLIYELPLSIFGSLKKIIIEHIIIIGYNLCKVQILLSDSLPLSIGVTKQIHKGSLQ